MDIMDLLFGLLCIAIVGVVLSGLLISLDVDNTRDNENVSIILYENSGERIIRNPDSYRFGNFGITLTKSGERITTNHYKLVEIEIN